MAAMSLAIVLYLALAFMRVIRAAPCPGTCDTPEHGFQCSPSLSHFWGPYSPYFSVASEIDAALPAGCELTFVQILSRHGARDPTASKTKSYSNLITRIHSDATSYGPDFDFIRHYNYTLGADQLTLFGQEEMWNSGIKFYARYQALARSATPFVRSAGQDRVVESAQNWTQGFHRARLADKGSTMPEDSFPYDILTIPEDAGYNNTLSHGTCTAFEDGPDSEIGDAAQAIWLGVFAPPITARLNANLPGVNLSDADTLSLMDLCPYNTVASAGGATISPFCGLFTEDEWRSYDYLYTLGKYYGYGAGNPLGPTQGVGWAAELVARLTGTPVEDGTSTNETLDGDASTFPLGLALYADFSHDNDMTGMYAALGLYNRTAPLSNVTRGDPAGRDAGYSASWTVPFAARMYVEKMSCPAAGAEELVRVLVNDRVIPLQGCGADELGRCRLGRFVDSLEFVREGGDWDLCFV